MVMIGKIDDFLRTKNHVNANLKKLFFGKFFPIVLLLLLFSYGYLQVL